MLQLAQRLSYMLMRVKRFSLLRMYRQREIKENGCIYSCASALFYSTFAAKQRFVIRDHS